MEAHESSANQVTTARLLLSGVKNEIEFAWNHNKLKLKVALGIDSEKDVRDVMCVFVRQDFRIFSIYTLRRAVADVKRLLSARETRRR